MRRTITTNLVVMLTSLFLAGCAGSEWKGDSPVAPTSLPPAFTAQALLLGTLTGELKEEVSQTLVLDNRSLNQLPFGVPVVIGHDGLTEEALLYLKVNFGMGSPLAMVDPTQSDLDRLRTALGFYDFVSVDGVEIYGVDREADGDLSEIFVRDAFPQGTGVENIYTPNGSTSETPVPTSINAMTMVDEDGESAQLGRTQIFANWVLDDHQRDQDTKILQRSEGTKNLRESATKREYRFVFPFQKNIHQMSLNVWSVYEATRQEYWFMCEESCILSALPAYYTNTEFSQGWFTERYFFDTRPGDDRVFLATGDAQPAPPTTEKSSTVSNKVSFSLSGKVGFSGKVTDKGGEVGASTEVAASTSWETAYSYTIKDVTVLNQSGSSRNNAAWTFEIPYPNWDWITFSFFGCVFDPKVRTAVEVSRGTFQPGMSWVWRVDPSVRTKFPKGLPVDVLFKTRIGLIERMLDCKFRYPQIESNQFKETVSVPWPPVIAP